MLYCRYMNYSYLYNGDPTTKLLSQNWGGVVTMSSAIETEFIWQAGKQKVRLKQQSFNFHWTTREYVCMLGHSFYSGLQLYFTFTASQVLFFSASPCTASLFTTGRLCLHSNYNSEVSLSNTF